MVMVECPDCGARNAENVIFCVRCGASLVAQVVPAEPAPGEATDELTPVTGEPEPLLAEAADLLGKGDAEGAVAKCKEALGIAPDLAAAYSLLGMAEEQRGNLAGAADAYRWVLEIDPGRTAEREKLELISAQLGDGKTAEQGSLAEARERNWLVRYAPFIAAGAAALFVLMVLTGIVVRVTLVRAAHRTYDQQMQAAQHSLDLRDYQAATQAFEAALEVRPDDRDAEQGLRYARRKWEQTGSVARAETRRASSPPAKIVSGGGPNPFAPVPIGPRNVEQPQTRAPRRAIRPPLVSSAQDEVDFGPSPIEPPAEQSEGSLLLRGEEEAPPEEPAPPTEEAPPPPERSRGEITIWISEAPTAGEETAAPGAEVGGPSPGEHASRASCLREQANALRRQDRCAEAAALYAQAIEEYRADSAANPRAKALNDKSIQACEAARRLCETSQG